MNLSTLPSWFIPIFLLAILVIAGAAEYLHLAPANTFYTVFLLVVGLVVPSPVFPTTHTVTTVEKDLTKG